MAHKVMEAATAEKDEGNKMFKELWYKEAVLCYSQVCV